MFYLFVLFVTIYVLYCSFPEQIQNVEKSVTYMLHPVINKAGFATLKYKIKHKQFKKYTKQLIN